jgi:hypothetical protein
LGAGASIGSDRYPKGELFRNKKMPSGPNFFADIFQMEGKSKNEMDFFNLLPMAYEGLNQLIQQIWKQNPDKQGWDRNEWEKINIEDVFSFIDTGTKIYPKNSNYRKYFESCKKSLIDFIFIMLSMRTLGQRCLHLQKLFKNISPNDSIVSFNWDTIADTTLEYLNNDQYKNYRLLIDDNGSIVEKYFQKGVLLKLHGSLNWMICNNKKCIAYNKNQFIQSATKGDLKNLSLSDFNKCKYCDSQHEINIIPPTSNKINIYKNSFIHKQWLLVRQKFIRSKKIVFIGYSFPVTDFYSEWLFRQINFLSYSKKKFVKYNIDVVNPESFMKRGLLYKRYRTLFKGHKLFFYNNLESYVNNIK